MVSKDAFSDRRRALEDEFFHRVDEKLLSEMKAKAASASSRKHLEAATGIEDEDLLDELSAAGATANSVAAISLVPLTLVAWADGVMDDKKRAVILKAAEDNGIAIGSPARMLLEHWLTKKPSRSLAVTWKHYITAVIKQMGVESRETLRADLLGRALAVANASGGVLGFGAISTDEKRVIAELEEALTL